MERRLGSTNRTVWDLVVITGVLIVGAGVGFWLSEQRNAARYQEVENELVKLGKVFCTFDQELRLVPR